MSSTEIANLVIAITGLVTAITAIVHSINNRRKINASQRH